MNPVNGFSLWNLESAIFSAIENKGWITEDSDKMFYDTEDK